MKKTLSVLLTLSFMLALASCGSSKKSSRQAITGSMNDSNLQALEIRQKYGIKTESDLVDRLKTVEMDLNDSGLYFAENTQPQIRPVYEGDKWSARKTKRKLKRAERKFRKGKKLPKGITLKKTVERCTDVVITLDYAPEGSYEAADVNGLLREYYDIAQLYLIETHETEENCETYTKIIQAQEQIGRVFMKSAPSQAQYEVPTRN